MPFLTAPDYTCWYTSIETSLFITVYPGWLGSILYTFQCFTVFSVYPANPFHLSHYIYPEDVTAKMFPAMNFTAICIATEITIVWLFNTFQQPVTGVTVASGVSLHISFKLQHRGRNSPIVVRVLSTTRFNSKWGAAKCGAQKKTINGGSKSKSKSKSESIPHLPSYSAQEP